MDNRINTLDNLPDSALVSVAELANLVGVQPTTIWRWAKSGLLPQPQRIGQRCTRWQLGGVRKALASGAGS
jgi:predicted DNA-binding transcriptional regulator AlpA